MRSPQSVIVRPVLTEKSTALTVSQNVITFDVARDANKIEIRQAIEKLFKVKVDKVRTAIVKGKPKRVRMSWGRTSDYKKAIVTLVEGQKIEVM